MESAVWHDPIAVADALAEMGLSLELLEDAVRAGEELRDSCTPNDPSSAPGYFSYAHTTRRLAELLVPLGWSRRDVANLALIVSPSEALAIVVSTGDEGTGAHYRQVKSKYPKGPATAMVVERNRQLDLFQPNPLPDEGLEEPDDGRPFTTWMLLRRRVGDTVFWELSLPCQVGEDGRVDEWVRRIVFQSISLTPRIDDDGGDSGDEIVIDVPRRS
jgi:hypothetical protein